MMARCDIVALSAALVLLSACGSSSSDKRRSGDGGVPPGLDAAAPVPPECRRIGHAEGLLPNVESQHRTLEFWLEQLARTHDLDEVLLDAGDIANTNRALAVPREDYHPQRDLLGPLDFEVVQKKVAERREWAREKLSSGLYLRGENQVFNERELAILDVEVDLAKATPQLRVALEDIGMRCVMLPESFYSKSLDVRIDRNACTNVRAQDVLLLLGVWPNNMQLVQSRHAFGWIPTDAKLSPAVPAKLQEAFVQRARLQVTGGDLEVQDKGGQAVTVAEGTRLAPAGKRDQDAYVATASGFVKTSRKQRKQLTRTARALTRRALFTEAWRYLGSPYGLGGTKGGRDCSRLLLDVFESFDLRLPRHSSWMARAGTFWIEVAEELPENERVRMFEAAAQKGVVLLSFPGHIMLYLGLNEHGTPMVLHAFREYAEPCAPGADKIVRVSDVDVSDLSLGQGTERRAFVERVTHITVIGKAPGLELRGVAEMRPVAEARVPKKCRDSRQNSIWVSPRKPHKGHPVHVIASMEADPGPARFTLIDPKGQRHLPDTVQLGGPPYGQVVTLDQPRTGRWKAILADGDKVLACQKFHVGSRGTKPGDPTEGPVWKPLNKWTRANENLYALFVERLFDYPIEEDLVWPNLHTLLQDSSRNILHDYRLPEEDSELELQPDCADLPYTLRAYYAWKMRLPFGYRRCTRAREGKPPECDRPGDDDNLISRLELKGENGTLKPRDDTTAFSLFANGKLMRAVHSSSGRTHPEDELTDFYPVPLTRDGLRPGTVFTDPYGHLLIVADWIPQGDDEYGILVGADAQPDGTVGRRRFWRGSFLFEPATESGGAGFKAFRPREYVAQPIDVEFDDRGEVTTIERMGYTVELINEELEKTRRFTRISYQQYEGSKDDFYNRIEGLINPRPLDPRAVQISLIDALAESVARRLNSVDNGEKWIAENPGKTMVMPEGASIFLTSGPWEEYSTPSRDLRLLISIDSVVGFPASVRSSPERFGLAEGSAELEKVAGEVEALLDDELGQRRFSYQNSRGQPTELSLKDLVDRQKRMEMAYNPNDCVEIRWGAVPDSDEMATCERHAPAEHRQRMESYRNWFSSRSRPPQ